MDFSLYNDIDIDFQTALHPGRGHVHGDLDVFGAIKHDASLYFGSEGNDYYDKERFEFPFFRRCSFDEVTDHSAFTFNNKKKRYEKYDANKIRDVLLVDGNSNKDVAITYHIAGLKLDELPACGTFVDKSIVPGFRYKVRKLDGSSVDVQSLSNNSYLFGGKALYLRDVSMGYGKRITFETEEGHSGNSKDNYFYSDNHVDGYGFTTVALEANQTLLLTRDGGRPVGYVNVEKVFLSKELSCAVSVDDGAVEKNVQVIFSCLVKFVPESGGLMSLMRDNEFLVSVTVWLRRGNNARHASVSRISSVKLPHFGLCHMVLV